MSNNNLLDILEEAYAKIMALLSVEFQELDPHHTYTMESSIHGVHIKRNDSSKSMLLLFQGGTWRINEGEGYSKEESTLANPQKLVASIIKLFEL